MGKGKGEIGVGRPIWVDGGSRTQDTSCAWGYVQQNPSAKVTLCKRRYYLLSSTLSLSNAPLRSGQFVFVPRVAFVEGFHCLIYDVQYMGPMCSWIQKTSCRRPMWFFLLFMMHHVRSLCGWIYNVCYVVLGAYVVRSDQIVFNFVLQIYFLRSIMLIKALTFRSKWR